MRSFIVLAASLLFGCRERKATVIATKEGVVLPACIGEWIPTDLATAKKPYANGVSWSGDGALVAVLIEESGQGTARIEGADGIVVWSSDGRLRERYRLPARSLAFARDGTRLAFASREGSGILDRRSGCARRFAAGGPLLAWSMDNRTVYVGGGNRVRAIDSINGVVLHVHSVTDLPRYTALSVGTNAIALLDAQHSLYALATDLSDLRTYSGMRDDIGNANAVAITPDGSLVAAGLAESSSVSYPKYILPGPPRQHSFFVRLVELPLGVERERFSMDPDALAFSPDGASLAIAGGHSLAVRTVTTKTMRVLDDAVSYAQQVAWSPDGRTLALADWRGAVRLYDSFGKIPPRILVP